MNRFCIRASFLCLLILTVGGAPISANTDNQDLRYNMATLMREDLESKLIPFLQAHAKQPINKDDVIVTLDVFMGRQRPQEVQANFLAGINVRVDLRYKPSMPDLDIATERFIYRYFQKRTPGQGQLTNFSRPVIHANVYIVEPTYTVMGEFRDGLVKFTIAIFILCVIFLLRYWPSFNNPLGKRQHTAPSHSALPPLHEPVPFPWATKREVVPSARQRIHPTQAFLDYQEKHLSLRVDPVQGSWYLHALPLVPQPNLQHTFEAMPFDEAVFMLKTIDSRYFDNIATRLDLHPALTRSLTHHPQFV